MSNPVSLVPHRAASSALVKSQLVIYSSVLRELGFDAHEFWGDEEINTPYALTIRGRIPANKSIPYQELIKKEVCLEIPFTEGIKRYFHGLVGNVTQESTPYKAEDYNHIWFSVTIYPKWWFLRKTLNHRIFQKKSALDIIETVLKDDYQITPEASRLTRGKQERDFCVQYNESDFDFLSRLMEDEGIFYYFRHEKERYVMVLADRNEHFGKAQGENPQTIEYDVSYVENAWFNRIVRIQQTQQVVPNQFQLRDYFFEKPAQNLTVTSKDEGEVDLLCYQYPGSYTTVENGEKRNKLYRESFEWEEKSFHGSSTVGDFFAGRRFSVKGHPVSNLNTEYVIYRVTHSCRQDEEGGFYENSFIAFSEDKPFYPPKRTPKPVIPGTQTAIVAGQEKKVIWTDEEGYGRIKVQFPWDNRSDVNKNEDSSCWIRVAYGWAGNSWGMHTIPRVGMEVVVSFLNGDPDHPLVVGCVYNGENACFYHPTQRTRSTWKSRSVEMEGEEEKEVEGSNEIRFEDKKEEEELYVHAQKDWNAEVENDHNLTVIQGHRSVHLQHKDQDKEGGNDSLTLDKGDRKVELKEGDLSETLKKGDHTLALDEGAQSITLKKGNQTIQLNSGNVTISLDEGNRTVSIKGNDELTVTGNWTISVTGNTTLTNEGAVSIQAANIQLNAEESMSLKAGGPLSLMGSEVSITAEGSASVTAPSVAVNGSGSVSVSSGSVSITGAETTITGAMVSIN